MRFGWPAFIGIIVFLMLILDVIWLYMVYFIRDLPKNTCYDCCVSRASINDEVRFTDNLIFPLIFCSIFPQKALKACIIREARSIDSNDEGGKDLVENVSLSKHHSLHQAE
jgi:hypothetical protein